MLVQKTKENKIKKEFEFIGMLLLFLHSDFNILGLENSD